AELLVRRQRAVEEEAGRHKRRVLRISLDGAPAEAGDQLERALDSSGGDALAAVPLAHVAAGDPPVRRQPLLALLVRGPALDPRQVLRRPELAPAQAVVAVEDERGVCSAGPDELVLAVAVGLGRLPIDALGVEPHAPATAEDPVVPLDQIGERGPRRLVERFDRVGHARRMPTRRGGQSRYRTNSAA